MARQARFCSPGRAHLVRLHAAQGASPLAAPDQRARFLQTMVQGLAQVSVRLHAYAVLPDAVLLLLTPQSAEDLSRFVQGLARRSSRARQAPQAEASVPVSREPAWAGRFQSALVQPGDWELTAMVWIDRAADRAGLSGASPWLWSSLGAHVGEAQAMPVRGPALSAPEAYWTLGNTPFAREAGYRERLDQGLTAVQMGELDAALRRGLAVGDDFFLRQMEIETGRRLQAAPRGRPRMNVA
ncbi:hypothetical protein [Thiomonas intermedia]|uniref:hypothetical protein n=1 Tax=Thiomonas intermedia TaxID=926 RepID=UPI0009A4F98F|nr:hypothetical protein [Thiomonas intermedia]